MAQVRVVFNSAYDLRRAPGVVALVENIGEKVLDAANDTLAEGEGYMMSSTQGNRKNKGRWAVRVFTASNHAKNSNAKHNTLLRVLLGAS